jgi:cation diffusion facilitator CzcD-associated flavoprotein CzcO
MHTNLLIFTVIIDWTEHYSSYREISDYLRAVARKHKIYEQTRFKTEVISIEWIDQDQMWKVDSRSLESPTQEIVSEYYNYV